MQIIYLHKIYQTQLICEIYISKKKLNEKKYKAKQKNHIYKCEYYLQF